jgi:hypothetical protein
MVSVADAEGDRDSQASNTPARLSDHRRIDIDPGNPPHGAHQLGEATDLEPDAAAYVQNLIRRRDRAEIEHLPLELLDQRMPVGHVQPAVRYLGIS